MKVGLSPGLILLLAGCGTTTGPADPLPSWNQGEARSAIIELEPTTGVPDQRK